MKRLLNVCLVIGMAIVLMTPAAGSAQDTVYRWKFIAIAPVQLPTGKFLADAFERVKKQTDGKLNIQFVYIGQTPYKGNDALRVIRDGLAEGIDMLNGYNAGDSPYLGVAELPFLTPEYTRDYNEFYATSERVWNNPVLAAAMRKEWDRFNAEPVGRFYWGINEISSKKPIRKPADLKGLQIRDYSPEGADVLKAFGASATQLTGADVYPALQRGICDGIISSMQGTLYAKWFEVLNSAYILHFRASSSHLVFNKGKYDSLPEEYRKILKVELKKATDQILEFTVKDTYRIEKKFAEELKWVVTYPGSEDYKTMRGTAKKAAWPKWLERVGPEGKAVLEACMKAAGDNKDGL
ncbi:MAG: TRAP transporter substrate-binding protein DctP [Proteobacteria bacterium]|nr:TRAP transporter substrate-binding protein DctP [Pseudomonadota bacterium]